MVMEQEDEMVRKAQTGDSEAFGIIYDQYFDQIYRFIYYKVFSKEVAEDLTSDTFLKALSRLSSYNAERGRFNSWIYQIARNTIIDHFRTKKTNVAIEDVFDLSHDERTVEQLDALSGLKKVEAYLETLPSRQREIIVLRVWEGKSFQEIAAILGGTEGSVKMSFSRSIRELRAKYGDSVLAWLILSSPLPFVTSSYYINI